MATKLRTFDFSAPSRLTTSDKATYPWDDWLDGDIWQIEQGEDFDGHPLMMERIVRTRATGRKAKVKLRHVAVNGDPWGIIVLQRVDKEGPQAEKKRLANEKRQATRMASNGKAEVTEATTTTKPVVDKAPPVKKASRPTRQVSKRPARKLQAVS